MTAMGMAAVLVGAPASDPTSGTAAAWHPLQVTSLAAMSVVVLVVLHVSGLFAAARLSYTRCVGWPLWQLIGSDLHPWLQGVRLGLAGIGAALVVSTAVVAVRTDRVRRWGMALAALFAAEMMLGLVIRGGGINAGVAATYSVLAVALLFCLGLLTAVALSARVDTDATPLQPTAPSRQPAEPGRR
jgi:cytochrome c oxidase assembly protein subunit 15